VTNHPADSDEAIWQSVVDGRSRIRVALEAAEQRGDREASQILLLLDDIARRVLGVAIGRKLTAEQAMPYHRVVAELKRRRPDIDV
jgi:hypothetical protein